MSQLPRGIRARGQSYLVDVTTADGRRTATCHSLEAAIEKQRELRGEAPVKPRAWSLQLAYETTFKVAWAGARGERTATVNAETALAHFGPDRALDTIDLPAIDGYIAALEGAGLSDGTINRKLAALSKMLSVAHARGGLLGKPHIPRRREGCGRIRYLLPKEEQALLHLLEQWGLADHRDAVIVLIDTGIRVGELFNLEARDADDRMLRIWQNKADLPRSVPCTKRAWAVVQERLRARPYGKLFPYDHNWIRRPWDRAKVTMGLGADDQFVPHALRHTCASRLIQKGVSLKVVQEWLGHKTITVTMRYAHLARANLLGALQALEEDL